MSDRLTEKCGVVGAVSKSSSVSFQLYQALSALQHRGQHAAGLLTVDEKGTYSHIDTGLVADVFDDEAIKSLIGTSGIGHVRYPTSGGVDVRCSQPITISVADTTLSVAHNGTLVNHEELRSDLESRGYEFRVGNDTEVLAREIAHQVERNETFVEALDATMERVHGSFSLTLAYGDTIFGVRDPGGNRPLVLGRTQDSYVLASESTALTNVGAELLRDVEPGEIIELLPDGTGFESYCTGPTRRAARCFFEYVYFAAPDSVIDGTAVYQARLRIGEQLWDEHGVETDVVLPVPSTGRPFATGYANAGRVALRNGLLKDRYAGRTFIKPTEDARERAIQSKFTPIPSVVEGKSVTIVDDSLVRGNTPPKIIALLRDAGARAVHVRIGSPPLIAPCYLGIDIASREELIAASHSVEEICDEIGADSLQYVSHEGLVEAIGRDEDELCLGCIQGAYPYDIDGENCICDVSRPRFT